jgi:GcrA cell cycle regulator
MTMETLTTGTWTEAKIARLRADWRAGLSITQIGKNLGLTRNAVVGKAHRLGLNKRASPIMRTNPAPIRGPRCKWPIGDPQSADFGFCQKSAVADRPYCADHCRQAYAGWDQAAKTNAA